jgi:cytosine/adenosine deaminase-related metal-dependent hydrolase
MLAEQQESELLAALEDQLRFAAACGTVEHADFREQGEPGARLLQRASANIGVRSLILSQFDPNPFDDPVLDLNEATLPQAYRDILESLLDTADGFSESTINDCTDPGWREIREVTQRRGKLRAIHVLEDTDYRSTSQRRTGRGDLARALDVFEPHLVVHMTVADDDEIAMLARSGVPAAINPRANATLGLPLPRVFALLESGVEIRLGTDNAMLNPPNLLAEMDFTWRLARSQARDPLQPDPTHILRAAVTPCDPREPLHGLVVGGPAALFLADFSRGALRRSQHLVASLVGRLTPADVLGTFSQGRVLHADPRLAQHCRVS